MKITKIINNQKKMEIDTEKRYENYLKKQRELLAKISDKQNIHEERDFRLSYLFAPEIFTNKKKTLTPLKKYNIYLLVQLTRAIVSLVILATGLTSYEYYYHNYRIKSNRIDYILYVLIVLTFLSIALYFVSLHYRGQYLTHIRILSSNSNIYFYEGIFRIFFNVLLLSVSLTFWGGRIYEFEYQLQVFLLSVQFCVQFFTIMDCMLKSAKPSLPRNNNRINKLKINSVFLMKLYLNNYFVFTTFFILINLILVCSVIIRISESRYLNLLKIGNFSKDFDYKKYIQNYVTYKDYKNCIWLVIMTVTTIGYGEIIPNTVLAKVLVYFLIIVGSINISYFVVGFFNIFEMEESQNTVLSLFDAIQMKNEMKTEIEKGIHYFMFKKIQEIKIKRKIKKKGDSLKKKIDKSKKEIKKPNEKSFETKQFILKPNEINSKISKNNSSIKTISDDSKNSDVENPNSEIIFEEDLIKESKKENNPEDKNQDFLKFSEKEKLILQKAQKIMILFRTKSKYSTGLINMTKHIDNYKIIKCEYDARRNPKNNLDYLKFLIGILDDIIEEIVMDNSVKDDRIFKILKEFQINGEKKNFKRSPFSKNFYELTIKKIEIKNNKKII